MIKRVLEIIDEQGMGGLIKTIYKFPGHIPTGN